VNNRCRIEAKVEPKYRRANAPFRFTPAAKFTLGRKALNGQSAEAKLNVGTVNAEHTSLTK